MSGPAAESKSKREPRLAWSIVADAPLRGLCLAREANLLLSWDETNELLVLDTGAARIAQSRADGRIATARISDDGSLVAVLLTDGRLLLLNAGLEIQSERQAIPDALGLAVDAHGRYVAVPSSSGSGAFYDRHGKGAGGFSSRVPLAFLCFVPARALLIGAATYGALTAFELLAGRKPGSLESRMLWDEKVHSKVGNLACTGDGGALLTSCFTHGIQRYDLQGQSDGSYHLGGTVTHAVPDFAGKALVAATQEGQLVLLSRGGQVRWKSSVPSTIVGLEFDPLGRAWYYALATGELLCQSFEVEGAAAAEPSPRSTGTGTSAPVAAARPPLSGADLPSADAIPVVSPPAPVPSAPAATSNIRRPEWVLPVAQSDTQAETAVLAVLDEPLRIGFFSNSLRLQVIHGGGESLGLAPEIIGVGRILRTAPHWIAAASDRMILLYDARTGMAQRVDASLVELTHLAIDPDRFGMAVVQERDRVGRLTVSGRWVWKQELRSPLEEIAIGPENTLAMSDQTGALRIVDAAGEPRGTYQSREAEPLCLCAAASEVEPALRWVTLARHQQVIRGHHLDGRVIWESPTPFECVNLQAIGSYFLADAHDGRCLAFDARGYLKFQARPTSPPWWFLTDAQGEPCRLTRQQSHLLCGDFQDRVIWRAIATAEIGPVAVSRSGVAVMLGRSLAWFPQTGPM